jgi:hypothetical protein
LSRIRIFTAGILVVGPRLKQKIRSTVPEPIGIWLGVWLHRRVSDRFFFRFVYVLQFVVALQLISDGLGSF